MSTYQYRWLIFKEKVVHLMETEIKDSACVDLLKLYQAEKGDINDGTASSSSKQFKAAIRAFSLQIVLPVP